MKCIFVLLVLFNAATVVGSEAQAETWVVEVRHLSVQVPERGGTMDATIWYPATAGGQATLIGESALFQGVSAHLNAPTAKGSWPLVLLSHGGLQSGPYIGSWMASRLSQHGFVVAVLRQPDPHSQTPQEVMHEIWLRPVDFSATLTAIETDRALRGFIDTNKVGVLGFFFGGTSALELAGARLDPQSFARSCDPGGTEVDCAWFAKVGINLHAIDPMLLAQSHFDRRISAAIVIDPELSSNLAQASLATISLPVEIINLGDPQTILPGLNGAAAAKAIPGARYGTLPGATRYSAFSLCKPKAAAILREAVEEPLCQDVDGHPRGEIHDRLATMVEAALRRTLDP